MKTFSYDSTFEGFLCVLGEIINIYKTIPEENIIIEKKDSLLKSKIIDTVSDTAKKTAEYIKKEFSFETFKTIRNAFLSEEDGIESLIIKYLRLCMIYRKEINSLLHIEEVQKIISFAKKVVYEAHRFKGLIRFMETEDGFLFAIIEPRYNILSLLGSHFKKRLEGKDWIISDAIRKKALVCKDGRYEIIELNNLPKFNLTDSEIYFQKLWKRYFKIMAIPERISSKLQKQNLPLYYRKNMTEFK